MLAPNKMIKHQGNNLQTKPLLLVTPLMTSPPAAETPSYKNTLKKRLSTQSENDSLYKKLLAHSRILPDPAADVVFTDPTHPIKSTYSDKHNDSEELEITPKYTVDVPTCCSYHRKEIHKIVVQYRKLLYNSPDPSKISVKIPTSKLERMIARQKNLTSTKDYPLSTVCVHWHCSPQFRGDTTYVKSLMSKFGDVSSVEMISGEAAIVVYESLLGSCAAVNEHIIQVDSSRLFCHWLHRTMQATKFVSTGTRLRAVCDEFISPRA